MITTKLTLSANKRIIADAKRLAASQQTSVSALFSRFVAGLKQLEQTGAPVPAPLTQRASGLIQLPTGTDDKTLIADALGDKYAL